MDRDSLSRFSRLRAELSARARLAEEAARRGDLNAARAELARTMTRLVGLFGILNGD